MTPLRSFFLFKLLFLDEPQHVEQYHRADDGSEQRTDETIGRDAEQPKDPAADESANDAHCQIAPQTETTTFHQFSGQPTGNQTNHEKQNQIHCIPLCQ